ncbi:MAG: TetR/AcrR family transcriptional regulator [Candidatus Dormibacteraeota bacterium]|uniref:TetR/AcrR family transcriptional regulator n=1 Tax=Candidatus Amunia macphersoniae TaxID=3127014 RepID=A0A934NG64_9BACT|nr:TetR/AcrR family transcriptional regulator [Candidatus Dormibacteraeota bacterium]
MVELAVRRRLPKAEREQQLVEVAQAVFAELGFRAASMDDIAQRAGVTKPILYDHFGSKDGLIAACIRRAGAQLGAEIAAAVDRAPGPADVLAAGFGGFFTFIESHGQGWFMLIGDSALIGEAAEALEGIRRQQAAYVAERLAAEFPALDTDELEAFSEAIIGACERLALWRRNRPGVSVAAATANMMSLVWGGLASLKETPS